jgi:hypothetical protein
MAGGGKANMKARADEHFSALKEIIPAVKRMMLFDYDDADSAFHPAQDNPALAEWRRKNIENYLLVPDAWKRAVLKETGRDNADLFTTPLLQTVDRFFCRPKSDPSGRPDVARCDRKYIPVSRWKAHTF